MLVVVGDIKILLNQIESHLWESANMLRSPVDAVDFNIFIFLRLFSSIYVIFGIKSQGMPAWRVTCKEGAT